MSADDLVSRLRERRWQPHHTANGQVLVLPMIFTEAADAIETRDAEITDQANIIRSLLDHKAYLNAEIERLREALTAFASTLGYDGRYLILCDDGSIVSDDELMDGDQVLIDNATTEGDTP